MLILNNIANNIDRDQAQRNVGPDPPSIVFDTQHNVLLKTGCIAWDEFEFR